MRKRRRITKNEVVIVNENMLKDLPSLVELVNSVDGPIVKWDVDRLCYGLVADRKYRRREVITRYGGALHTKKIDGDYVLKIASDTFMDGRVGFKLSDKGRWTNESDRKRKIVNISLGREMKATRDIEAGEWLFTDYGDEYERNY